jgi:transposase
LQAVRLYGNGLAVEQIMDLTGCAESSMRDWVPAYQREGMAAWSLHSDRSAQNASKRTAEQRMDLWERLRQYRPEPVRSKAVRGSPGPFWTVSDRQRVVEQG